MFTPTRDRASDGSYVMTIDLDEEDSGYDMSLLISFGCPSKRLAEFESLPIRLSMVSPEGKIYADSLDFGRSVLKSSNWWSHHIESAIGEGLVPHEHGTWQVKVDISDSYINRYNISGAGIRVNAHQ